MIWSWSTADHGVHAQPECATGRLDQKGGAIVVGIIRYNPLTIFG